MPRPRSAFARLNGAKLLGVVLRQILRNGRREVLRVPCQMYLQQTRTLTSTVEPFIVSRQRYRGNERVLR